MSFMTKIIEGLEGRSIRLYELTTEIDNIASYFSNDMQQDEQHILLIGFCQHTILEKLRSKIQLRLGDNYNVEANDVVLQNNKAFDGAGYYSYIILVVEEGQSLLRDISDLMTYYSAKGITVAGCIYLKS